MQWRSRIVGHDEVDPASLMAHPLNWRTHSADQAKALGAVIRDVGVVQSVIVNRRSGHIIDGHLRVSMAVKDKAPSIPVVYVDMDESEEATVLATLDPIGAMAGKANDILASLVQQVATSDDDVLRLIAEIQGHSADTVSKHTWAKRDRITPSADVSVNLGDAYLIGGRHIVYCDDAQQYGTPAGDVVTIWDPPWDVELDIDVTSPAIAFTDGRRMGDVVAKLGAPTWTFVWDCGSTWYTPNRPLQRTKLALWYGDITTYQYDGYHLPAKKSTGTRTVSNSRGQYAYTPDPRGVHLADLYTDTRITDLHAEAWHAHQKPTEWVTALIGCCSTASTVYDPCLGSGVSLIAADTLGRTCIGYEISPIAVQHIIDYAEQSEISVEKIDGR